MEHGEFPRQAPEFSAGLYAGFIVDPEHRVFASPVELTPERAHQLLSRDASLVVDPCGCGAGCALDWIERTERRKLSERRPAERFHGILQEWRGADGAVLIFAESLDWLVPSS